MPRYVIKPRAGGWVDDDYERPTWNDWAGHEPHRPSLDVDGSKEVDTGLVTASGEAIYRVGPPIGFGRMEEW